MRLFQNFACVFSTFNYYKSLFWILLSDNAIINLYLLSRSEDY